METLTIQRRTISLPAKEAKCKLKWTDRQRIPRKLKKKLKKKFRFTSGASCSWFEYSKFYGLKHGK